MSQVNFRDFKPLDLHGLNPLKDVFDTDAKKLVLFNHKEGSKCFTIYDDYGVIGVAGGTLIWKNVANLWTVLGDGIYRNPRQFSIVCRSIIEYLFYTWNLVRAEAHVKVGHDKGVEWIERFDFVREGVMKNYLGLGKDAYLYARYD